MSIMDLEIRKKLKEMNLYNDIKILNSIQVERYEDSDDIGSIIDIHFLYKNLKDKKTYKGIISKNAITMEIDVEKIEKKVKESINELNEIIKDFDGDYNLKEKVNDLIHILNRKV